MRNPILRAAHPDIPIPFSKPLEDAITPIAGKVIAVIRRTSDLSARSTVTK